MRMLRPASAKSDDLVAMIRSAGADWTPDRLWAMIRSGQVPDGYVGEAARFVVDRPHLWTVSDAEFIAAVALVDPDCAEVFRTPAGLDFMHRMSQKVMWRVPMVAFGLGDKA